MTEGDRAGLAAAREALAAAAERAAVQQALDGLIAQTPAAAPHSPGTVPQ